MSKIYECGDLHCLSWQPTQLVRKRQRSGKFPNFWLCACCCKSWIGCRTFSFTFSRMKVYLKYDSPVSPGVTVQVMSSLSFPHHCQSLLALFQPNNQNEQSRFLAAFLPVLPNFLLCACCKSWRGSCWAFHGVFARPRRGGEQPPAAGPVSRSRGRGSSPSLLCPVVPRNQAGEKYVKKYILKYTRQERNTFRNTF